MIKKIFKNNLYLATLSKIYMILAPKERVKAGFIFFTTFINGLLDVLGIAMIIPVIYLLNDLPKIHENAVTSAVYKFFNFQTEVKFVIFLMVLLTVVFVLKNALSLFFVYIQEKFIVKIGKDLTLSEFKKYLNKDYLFISNHNSNQLVQEIARVPLEFSKNILSPIMFITTEFFVVFLILTGILIYDYRILLLLGLSIVPITYLLNAATKSKVEKLGKIRHKNQIKSFKEISESLHAYIDVKLTNKQHFFINKTNHTLEDLYHSLLNIKVINNIPIKLIETSAVLGIGIIYLFVAYFFSEPHKIVPILVLFATASYRLLPSFNRIITSLMLVRNTSYVFNTISNYNNEDIRNYIDKELEFKESIELINISYKYPEKDTNTLEKINLKINKGAIVGFIGQSGSGKTTLGKLILRLIEEQNGDFLLDGKKLGNNEILGWNNLLGYVQQDYYLLDTTLAENIAFGLDASEIDFKKVEKVIEQVQLKELISSLKDGVHTQIGEFGGKLSGGQRQRIAIARALYKDAQILLFDEATSALDNETEKEIMSTLYGLKELNLTILIIAHRLTTLEKCSVIYELSNGSIVNKYNFSELISEKFN